MRDEPRLLSAHTTTTPGTSTTRSVWRRARGAASSARASPSSADRPRNLCRSDAGDSTCAASRPSRRVALELTDEHRGAGIDRLTVDPDFEVEVRTGGAAGGTDATDLLTRGDERVLLDLDLAEECA
jgi:hypothetical protein